MTSDTIITPDTAFTPELLSPAGTFRNMEYAFAYGADAVYAGQPRYSLRVRNNDFQLDNLAKGIDYAHSLGKQFYVASNIAPHNSKVDTYMRDIEPVIAMQPDALIMSDPGLIMLVKDKWPDQVIHLSVQANVVNYASVEFWRRQGVSRIILSRELSIEEIAEIRQRCPEMEIEVFVHGALCIAYSGRCLLSGYMNHRDPNQGTCTNACRWKYDAHEAKQTDSGDIIPVGVNEFDPTQPNTRLVTEEPPAPTLGSGATSDRILLLQEGNRDNEYMPAFEDEHGTYIMNSRDLRAIQHIEKLVELGVHSLKIEGRTKSHYYVGRTAQAYRQAIDDAVAGRRFDKNLMDTLEHMSNRGYTEGFFRRHVHDEYQNYERGSSLSTAQQFVGEVSHSDGDYLTIEVKNRFQLGDSLELMTTDGNTTFILRELTDSSGQPRGDAPGSGFIVRIAVPEEARQHCFTRAMLIRNLPPVNQA